MYFLFYLDQLKYGYRKVVADVDRIILSLSTASGGSFIREIVAGSIFVRVVPFKLN